jgi:hypothetical protein
MTDLNTEIEEAVADNRRQPLENLARRLRVERPQSLSRVDLEAAVLAAVRPRVAEVTGGSAEAVARYLPGNYRVGGELPTGEIVVIGRDSCGWTLEDYVLRQWGGRLMPLYYLLTEDDKLVGTVHAASIHEASRKFRTLPEWARPGAAKVRRID